MKRPEFRWSVCATLRRDGPSAYAAVVAMRSCRANDLDGRALAFETPWSNVVVTRRTMVVPRTRGALQAAGFVFAAPLLLLTTGADYGAADLAVLEVVGISVGVSGMLFGSSLLFPGPHTRIETLGPASVRPSFNLRRAASTSRPRSPSPARAKADRGDARLRRPS